MMLHYNKSDLVGSKSGLELIDIGHKDMANQLSDDLIVVGEETRPGHGIKLHLHFHCHW